MKLHNALQVAGQKHNRYCGPAALAAMTGLNTGEAAALLRRASGKASVRGCHTRFMIRALAYLGLEVHRRDYSRSDWPTIGKWLKTYTGQPVILVAGNHYWALSGDQYVDSFNRIPTPISKIRQPRARVESVLILWDPNED